MKATTLILILVFLGIVGLGGGLAWGLFGAELFSTKLADTNNTAEIISTPSPTIKSTPVAATPIITPSEQAKPTPSPTYTIEPGLVAYYPFDQNSQDYSGQKNHGTNYGATLVGGKIGQALSFDGKDDYVYTPISINPIPMPQMTMTAWVKTEDNIGIRQVVSHDNGGYDRAMGMDNRGGGQGWSCFAGNGRVLGSHPITVGKWTFIAAVYDQEAGTVKLFVDGSTYQKEGKIVGVGGNDYILIGARGSTKGQSERFAGVIDEVKIYDYALTDKELNSLYKK